MKTGSSEPDRLRLLTYSRSLVVYPCRIVFLFFQRHFGGCQSPNTHRKKQRVCQEAIPQQHVTLQTLSSRQRLLVQAVFCYLTQQLISH